MFIALGILRYGLVLLYGVLLSVDFAGGCSSKRERNRIGLLCIALLVIQVLSVSLLGLNMTTRLYPVITHLPIILALVLLLKKQWGVAIVSVLTAYFCCQLPDWFGTLTQYLFGTELAYRIGYIVSIFPLFFLLRKYLTGPAHRAMSYSSRSLFFIGALPLFFYLFDYATTVYSKALYNGIQVVSESLPAAMALFYAAFVAAYHNEVQQRSRIELQNSMLAMQLSQAKNDVFALSQRQEQTIAYRHDMRHHLTVIGEYLLSGDSARALEYIQSAEKGIEKITPVRYCENPSLNLILSAFAEKAKRLDVDLSIEATIPAELPLPEAELCALFSNALENAIIAAAQCDFEGRKAVRINCQPHKGKLLIYISNPYQGEITIHDGLPQSKRPGHGLGVKSIQMIAESHNGYCSFEAQNGLFTLKVVLPLEC